MKRASEVTPDQLPQLAIRDWAKRFETSRTRELRTMAWLPEPTDLSSDMYAAILDHPDGAAHFGVSIALHIVASKTKPRNGYLRREDGRPHDAKSLARVTRIPESVMEAAISRLLEIGDLEVQTTKSRKPKAAVWRQDATPPPEGTASLPLQGTEQNHHHQEQNGKEGTEQQGTEGARDFSPDQDSAAKRGKGQPLPQSASLDDDGKPPKNLPDTRGVTKPTPINVGKAAAYATPADELKAMVVEYTGSPIEQELLDCVRSRLGGEITQDFIDELKPHRGPFTNYAGFIRKRAMKRSRPASAPVTAEEAAAKNYQCQHCASRKPGIGALVENGKGVPCSCASDEYIAEQKARGVFEANAVRAHPPAKLPSCGSGGIDLKGMRQARDVLPITLAAKASG